MEQVAKLEAKWQVWVACKHEICQIESCQI
jgi:hypothetical protein